MQTLDNIIHDPVVEAYFERYPNDCILDIETTGFNKITDTIIILGLIYKNNSKIHVLQWCCDSLSDEKILIEKIVEFSKKGKRLITYNGNSFDIPFIEKKCELYKLKLDRLDSFDLYDYIKAYFVFLPFDNMKLNTLISYFNSDLDISISGGDCVYFYHKYLKTSDSSFLDKIIAHNSSDLIGLCHALKSTDLLKSILSLNLEGSTLYFENQKLDSNKIYLDGYIINKSDSLESVEMYLPYGNLSINTKTNRFNINLEFRILRLNENSKLMISDTNALNIINLPSNVFGLPRNVIPLAIKVDKQYKFLMDSIKWAVEQIYSSVL